jgi:hypothetical protein
MVVLASLDLVHLISRYAELLGAAKGRNISTPLVNIWDKFIFIEFKKRV